MNGKTSRNGHDGHARNRPSTAVCDGAGDATPAPQPETKPPTQPTANPERTANGQFAKGNRFGLGNPFARRLGALRSAFLNAITDADVAVVARKLTELAASGDVQAAALFLAYAVGKPQPSVNPDRLDLDEFAIVDAAPTKAKALTVALDVIHPIAAANLARSCDSDDETALLTKPSVDLLQRVLVERQARAGRPCE